MAELVRHAVRPLARRRSGSRGRGRPRHGACRRTRRRRHRLLVARLRVAGGRVARLRGRTGRPARRRSRRGGRRAVGRVAGRGRAAGRGQHGRWRRRSDSVESRRHRAAEDASSSLYDIPRVLAPCEVGQEMVSSPLGGVPQVLTQDRCDGPS
eukprot:scaffold19136_cov31-Phaeocystis_antarctica.AAC.2